MYTLDGSGWDRRMARSDHLPVPPDNRRARQGGAVRIGAHGTRPIWPRAFADGGGSLIRVGFAHLIRHTGSTL